MIIPMIAKAYHYTLPVRKVIHAIRGDWKGQRMSKSRVVNSAVNTIFNFSVKLFDFGIKFVLRTVFIYTLGMQFVGVSGLFTDIL